MRTSHRTSGRLTELRAFGSNPGALKAFTYCPPGMEPKAPLVVVLHGCTQTADGYDLGAGWSHLADKHGFALLYPEQQRANNPNLCFNWFVPEDIGRGSGEACSIRQMIARFVATQNLDAGRVYVTGLSAGGAMTAVMLATYPEVFAGGAIIAGLPYGSATTVAEAFERMQGKNSPPAGELHMRVRSASNHDGPWPILSVWHGTHDHTVRPRNRDQLVEQWRMVHGLDDKPSRTDSVNGYKRHVWLDASGRERLESFEIVGMAHGVPLATRGPDGLGSEAPFMLETGISSAREIARFWGLLKTGDARRAAERDAFADDRTTILDGEIILPGSNPEPPRPSMQGAAGGSINKIEKVINDALRSAGLLR
ncbi:MAG: hypothetical protein JWM58_2509 [Rhizobium sp.]|nr:hypothetical protein [Rhizobium sp.]